MSFGSVTASALADFPQNAIRQSRGQVTPAQNSLQFPTQEDLLYGVAFKFLRYKYDITGTKAELQSNIQGAHIFLPLPLQLTESLGLSYNTQELGVAGKIYQLGWKAGSKISDLLSGASSGGLGVDMNSAVNTGLGIGEYVVRGLIGGASSSVGSSVDLSLGNVVNPYTIATFSSTQTRQHTLTFRLISQSESDSTAIKNICDNFKWHSLPDKVGADGLFLSMPDEVEVCYFGTQFLYQFARCVITGVQINHAGFGQPSFFATDGAPVCVELTLQLEEIEQLNRTAYGKPAGIVGEDEPIAGPDIPPIPAAPSDMQSDIVTSYEAELNKQRSGSAPVNNSATNSTYDQTTLPGFTFVGGGL